MCVFQKFYKYIYTFKNNISNFALKILTLKVIEK